MQNVMPAHPHVSSESIANCVIPHVSHVQLTARVRQHFEHIVLWPRRFVSYVERRVVLPALIPLVLDFLEVEGCSGILTPLMR